MPVVQGWDPAPVLARLDPTLPDGENADRLNVSVNALRSWRHGRRRISGSYADRIARELGLHPVNLWPTWPTPEVTG